MHCKCIIFILLISCKLNSSDLMEQQQQVTPQEDPINVLPSPDHLLEEQGEQFDPEFSDSLVEILNPSSTIEVQEKSEEFAVDGSLNITVNQSNDATNVTASQNGTEKNTTESKQLRCVLKVLPEGEDPQVHLVNTSTLAKALQPIPNVTSGECALVMFYSPYCPFSVKAAPYFNALPRLYPHFSFFALDAVTYTSMNMRYGLVAIPTILLFHNGKGIVKFNESEPTLERLVTFLEKYTGITAKGNVTVQEEDEVGPISSVRLESTDYLLIISWTFTIMCFCWWFAKSSLCNRIVESVRNTWREAEAQHDHVD